MKTKYCRQCGKEKRIGLFASSGWCKSCMSKYLREYKSPRLEFRESILSEEDMDKEMRMIKKIDPKGLNAMVDLAKQFDQAARSIKTFDSPVKLRDKYSYNRIVGFKSNI